MTLLIIWGIILIVVLVINYFFWRRFKEVKVEGEVEEAIVPEIKIMKSTYPKRQMEINKWFRYIHTQNSKV